MSLAVTRIVNACVLIELDGVTVLTDPYFDPRWFLRLGEPIGLRAVDLPPLTAILGCHGVFDHWQPRSLAGYRHSREVPVFVATRGMARAARGAGFVRSEVLAPGESRTVSDLRVDVVPAARGVNSYLLSTAGHRVFVGGEARDVEPLRGLGPVDLAVLPIDGATFFGQRLVMDTAAALAAAQALEARTLVPFHYAVRPLPPLFSASGADLPRLRQAPGVVVLEPGVRWTDAVTAAG